MIDEALSKTRCPWLGRTMLRGAVALVMAFYVWTVMVGKNWIGAEVCDAVFSGGGMAVDTGSTR